MALTLSDQLKEMSLGDHLCLVYENQEEQMAAVVPYLRQGLLRNEACIYITNDLTLEEVRAALYQGGIDVAAEEQRGALTFATKRESYFHSGDFDPDSMIVFLEKAVRSALDKGFSGYRITGEMTWALGDEGGCNRLIEYEAKLNRFFPNSKSTAICQYNRNRFRPEVIRDVLRTHPVAIIGNQVCPNLYYEDPDMVLGESTVKDQVDWMVGQLKRFQASELNLKEAIVVRDEFLSVASHELKTPLTSLSIQVQMLERGVKAGASEALSSPKIAKRVDMVGKQTKRLAALVETLLDLSRANQHQISLNCIPISVATVVTEVVQRFTEEADEKGVSIQMGELEPFEAEVDRFRMDQVLSNLLSNALKYGEAKPIQVDVCVNSTSFQISIKDEGMGIKEADQRRIFSRFERAVSAQNISGLGLGLFIADEIVKAHGGKILVQSQVGVGSTFTVVIPFRQVPLCVVA